MVVPHHLRKPLLKAYHDDGLGAHQGVAKTLGKLHNQYYWPRMGRDVQQFVQTCFICQRRKPPNTPQTPPVKHIQSHKPFELLEVDVMELPLSYHGNRYVVVFADHFTKFPKAFAVADQKAETIAKLLFEGIICRYGAPCTLLSDRGTNFLSNIVQELCRLMHIRKVTSTAYSPQMQGLVERLNRSLQDLLAKLVEEDQHSWDDYLPQVLFAIRSAPQATTQETPAYLLYGQDLQLPLDRTLNFQPGRFADVDELPYLDALQHRLTTAWRLAQEQTQPRFRVPTDTCASEACQTLPCTACKPSGSSSRTSPGC